MPRRQHRCNGCSVTWSDLNYCHCSKCHSTFATAELFDLHRKEDGKGCLKRLSTVQRAGKRIIAYDRDREVWTHAA